MPHFTLPADGLYHLVPIGEFPHRPSGVAQVIDETACAAMVRHFAEEARQPEFAGLLMDFDHFSHDPQKPSEAAGWVTRLEARPDGVWGEIRWSDTGLAAVQGGRYRFVSPVFDRADMQEVEPSISPIRPFADSLSRPLRPLRPLRLARLALTNDPNLHGLTPLSNRLLSEPESVLGGPALPLGLPAAGTAADPVPKPNPKPKKDHMSTIATLLGLAPEASEDALAAGIEQLKNRVTELEQHNRSLLEAEFQTRFAQRVKPEVRAQIQEQFLANRAATILILEGVAAVSSPAPEPPLPDGSLYNRRQTHPPVTEPGCSQTRELRQREVEAYRAGHPGCAYDTAWNAVRATKPELFQESER